MHHYQELDAVLPEERACRLRTEPDCYGASSLIARRLNLPFVPRSYAYWSHGWHHLPLKYIETYGYVQDVVYLVATKAEATFLRSKGRQSHAIGAPFIQTDFFIESFQPKRVRNSLLIIPPHGMSYTMEEYREQEYLEDILPTLKDFSTVAALVHPADIMAGRWVDSFQRHGIKVLSGAQMSDGNALFRMRAIFESFEYVTTNTIGSHIAYSIYSGCKVSIYGSYQFMAKENLANDDLYKKYPDILDFVHYHYSAKSVSDRFPTLFCRHPKESIVTKADAEKWLGAENYKSAFHLARLLKWWPEQQLYQFASRVYKKLK